MSLAFLSKKSWHTANLSNQEKVWMAEQQKEAEEAKIKEIQKQIQVEREREELERISGRISSKIDRGIDWMYEGGVKEEDEKNREAEEYLLGKAFEGVPNEDVAVGGVDTVVSAVVNTNNEHQQQSIDYYEEEPEKDWNEEFRLRHEDPMFLVSQSKGNNASLRKTKALLQQQEQPRKSSGKHDKKEKKHHKKHKSDRKKSSRKDRKRSRHSPSPSPTRKRSRSPSPISKYGLQSSHKTSLPVNNLGPDPNLIQQRKKQSQPVPHRSSSRRKLTSEEKAKAIEEMQSHAIKRDRDLHKASNNKSSDDDNHEQTSSSSKSFINDLKCSVHGVDHDISLADRVQRKRHTNQNLSGGFL